MTDEEIIALLLLHEGGLFTNDPLDAGGPTRWGVTRPVLAAYRHVDVSTITIADIEHLTRAEATDVYRMVYIEPFVTMPLSPFRVNVIDMAVNAGVFTAIRLLQETVGAVVDGHLGPQTIRLVTTRNWNLVYIGVRIAYYEDLVQRRPTNLKWRNGWRNRALSFLSPVMLMGSPRAMTVHERNLHPRFGTAAKALDLAA